MGNVLCLLKDTPGHNASSRREVNSTSTSVVHGSPEKAQRLRLQYHVSNQATSSSTNPKAHRKTTSYISKIKSKSSHLLPSFSSSPSSTDFSSPTSLTPTAAISDADPHLQKQREQQELYNQQQLPPLLHLHNRINHTNLSQGSGPGTIVFSRSHSEAASNSASNNNSINNGNDNSSGQRLPSLSHRFSNATGSTSATASTDSNTSYSLEKMKERNQISVDYQWLEGRRYHNTPGASYLLPNDIDEVDRLQLQHFILRYAIQGNYKSPLEKSKVRSILDVGCGPGTWTMEMANEFPDATITGIDMSAVFPTTIIPGNCRFIQHNILQPFPFPDNTFDFVYQRLLVAGLTPDDWVRVLAELERVTKPGGWIELVEVDGFGGNNGPCTAKIWGWVDKALQTRGVNCLIGQNPGLCFLLKQAKVVNVQQDILRLPTGDHGGKIGQLLKENEQSFWSAITPIVIHGAGVDKDEYEEALQIAEMEVEEYKSYHIFYVVTGQKSEKLTE